MKDIQHTQNLNPTTLQKELLIEAVVKSDEAVRLGQAILADPDMDFAERNEKTETAKSYMAESENLETAFYGTLTFLN